MDFKAKVLSTPDPFSTEQLCLRYATYSEEYAKAAETLEEQQFFSVRYYLFSHAFELVLKSFILAKGGDEKKIRGINHSLKVAYDEAVKMGYTPRNQSLPELIDWLDPFHQHQDFRYGGPNGLVIMPNTDQTMDIFKDTHSDILPLAKQFYARAKAR